MKARTVVGRGGGGRRACLVTPDLLFRLSREKEKERVPRIRWDDQRINNYLVVALKQTKVVAQRQPNPQKHRLEPAFLGRFCYFFRGLGWPWIMAFVGFNIYTIFKTFYYPTNFSISQTSLRCLGRFVGDWPSATLGTRGGCSSGKRVPIGIMQ